MSSQSAVSLGQRIASVRLALVYFRPTTRGVFSSSGAILGVEKII